MNDDDRRLEENTSRLIVAGFGPEARPDPRTCQETLRRLTAQLRVSRPPVAFPQLILGLLVGMLMVMAAWLVNEMMGPKFFVRGAVPNLVIASVLSLNVAFVPIAAIVIVIRRCYVDSTQEGIA